MNQKAYSVLFCALLASTFVHELRAKGVAPVSSRKLDVFGSRAAPAEVCYLECTVPLNSTTSFGITIEVYGNVIVVANLSASAALLLDVTTQIVVVLNGTSGAGVAIDLQAQSGVYISSGLWVGGKANLEALIQVTLGGSLRALWNIKGAVTFTVRNISSAILTVINSIVVRLVIGISAQIARDARLGLEIILSIAGQLIVLFNGDLSGALKLLIASGTIAVVFDLAGLVVALRTLSIIIRAAGGIQALIAAGVILDLSLILGASSGLYAFANLLLQLSESSEALKALKVILESDIQVLQLIGGLGGGILIGITGAFVIIGRIALLGSKNVTLEGVISGLITYVTQSSVYVTANLTESLTIGLQGLITVIERINVTGDLSGLLTIITSLRAGSLILGGINVARILFRLVSVYVGVSALLAVVVAVALELTVVSRVVAINTLLLVLISKLSLAVGIQELIQLGIRIQVGILTTFASIIAASISLIPSLLLGGVYKVLLRLSTFGVIVSALEAALKATGCGLTLEVVVNQSRSLILGYFQLITHVSLQQSATVQAEASKILTATGSISGYLSGGLNVTWSGSASGNVTISG